MAKAECKPPSGVTALEMKCGQVETKSTTFTEALRKRLDNYMDKCTAKAKIFQQVMGNK